MTRGQRRLVVLALVAAAAAAGTWWTLWGPQWRQQVAVEAGMKELAKTQPRRASLLASRPAEDRLRDLAEEALDPKSFDPPRPALAEAALRSAMRQASRDAALDLGVHYRDGKLGTADTGKALALFDTVREATDPATRAGEASALIVLGRIYAEGLGVHADQAKAVEMTLRGAAGGTPAQKYRVAKDHLWGSGVFNGRANEDEDIRAGGAQGGGQGRGIAAAAARVPRRCAAGARAGAGGTGWLNAAQNSGGGQALVAAGTGVLPVNWSARATQPPPIAL